MTNITTHYCQCGCGSTVGVHRYNDRGHGYVRGEPKQFVLGHSFRKPRDPNKVQRREYIAIAEKALGRPLPPKAVVHHVNEDPTDNRNSNLVICEDQAYHNFLHARLRAFKATGHVDWRKCTFCKHWGPPSEVKKYGKSTYFNHTSCATAHRKTRPPSPASRKKTCIRVMPIGWGR